MTYFESILPTLMQSCQLMGQGMLGIFIGMSSIALVVYITTKVSSKKS